MHGTPQESAGNVLRGRLVLELCEVTKIKSIKLTFQGKSKVVWQGDSTSKFQSEEKTIFQHDWIFLEQKKYHILAPGNYNWGFELVLPGSLPETIAGCDHGSIEYKLKAIAERHSFALNLNARQKITLQRCSFLNSEDALDTVVANTWTDRVVYDFSVDSKTLTLGDDISLSLDIKPLNQSLRVREYSCTFNECISYSVGTHKRSISKTLNSVRGDNLHWNDYLWTDSLKIKIPKSKTICHYDTDNSIIQITHELRLSIIFAVEDNRLVELRATLPIIITLNNDDMELPPYREFDPFNVNNVNSHRINELYEYVNISLPSYDSIITDNTSTYNKDLTPPPPIYAV
ncbi:arrestin domain-containing protein [Gigaspora margarita]|uniref:Arrestin domain-containing protein n=1 Tax=Gigaspora margarita TaxID=4874 RepID=A0A8H4EH75_GIGMA|nr:arrestin domain-containing protein [Gigaspora margarita]